MDILLKQIKAVATPTVIFSDIGQVCKVLAMEGVPSGTYAVGTRRALMKILILESEVDNLQLAIRHKDYVFQLPLIKTGFKGSYSLCVCMPGCGPTDLEAFKVLWNRTHGCELKQFEDVDGNRVKSDRPISVEIKDSTTFKHTLQIKETTCSKKVDIWRQKSRSPSPDRADAADKKEVPQSTPTKQEEVSSSSDELGETVQTKGSADHPAKLEDDPDKRPIDDSDTADEAKVDDGVTEVNKAEAPDKPPRQDSSDSTTTKVVSQGLSESTRKDRELLKSGLPESVIVMEESVVTIRDLVGKGRFSSVYTGHLQTGRKVAVKKMNPDLVGIKSFHRQVYALGTLAHQNVLPLVGICLDGECLLMLTDYLEGGTLFRYLRGPNINYRTQRELVGMALQVATGMEFIERKRWLHGDLATKYVLMNSTLDCKITGFGAASSKVDFHYVHSQSHSYAASIEVHQNKLVTSKSDVWSFGILFMEIMSRGETPYRGRVDPAQLKVYLEIGNRWKRPDCVRQDHYSIMQRCWKLKPKARPSFQQLVAELSQ